jgi:hypothetical protein
LSMLFGTKIYIGHLLVVGSLQLSDTALSLEDICIRGHELALIPSPCAITRDILVINQDYYIDKTTSTCYLCKQNFLLLPD